jgi:hypothetical protein
MLQQVAQCQYLETLAGTRGRELASLFSEIEPSSDLLEAVALRRSCSPMFNASTAFQRSNLHR